LLLLAGHLPVVATGPAKSNQPKVVPAGGEVVLVRRHVMLVLVQHRQLFHPRKFDNKHM
jgi:hypothetical protein